MEKYIAAVDLGTTKIVCLLGEEQPGGGYRIVAFREAPSKGILRGEVVNIQHVINTLMPLIRDIKAESGVDFKEVFVGIAGQNIRCIDNGNKKNRNRSSELISEEEVETMEKEMYNSRVNSEERVLHVIPQSYNIDDHIGVTDPVGMLGNQIEGNYKLFIGRTNSATHSESVITRAGLRLKELILEPIASAKAVLTPDEMELGVALVDIGGGTTDLIVIEDGIVRHAAVIPFGGNVISEDLRQGCGVTLRDAELIKIQHGSAYKNLAPENKIVVIPGMNGRESKEISFKLIASIIEARMAEIIEAIAYEIERSGFSERLSAGIVLTGGGSQLSNIAHLVKYETGYDVRIAAPNISIADDSCENVSKPSSSTAVGLIMRGFELNRIAKYGINQTNYAGKLFPETEFAQLEEAEHSANINKKKIQKEKEERSKKRNSLKTAFGGLFEFVKESDDEA